jgi:hypothetical protein
MLAGPASVIREIFHSDHESWEGVFVGVALSDWNASHPTKIAIFFGSFFATLLGLSVCLVWDAPAVGGALLQ